MTEQSSEHGELEVHLPDPSVWPLIVGLAALFVGLALTWWVRDRSNDFAGPVLGAAIAGIFIAIAGWAYDDSKMRRKAGGGGGHGPQPTRFTQVVTFAVAEGQLMHARSEGIINAIERSDNHLRDLAGFQDLRIIASPSQAGPSQVLVETTWSNREGLATYDETRQTMLDLVSNNPEDVIPGSVQVFDMEVVRDTKEVAFRFGLAPAFAVFGALIAGGFVFGAALSAFQNDNPVSNVAPGGTETPADGGLTLIATDNKFDKATLTVPPNTQISLDFKNNGVVKHNVHFLDKAGGNTLADGAEGAILDGGKSETLTFTTPGPGTYYFQCDLHPDEMKGNLEVKEGAPNPSGGGGVAAPSGAVKVIATDSKFDKASIDGNAGKEIEVDLENQGKVPHNIHFYDKAGGNTLADGAEGAILAAGKSEAIKFTPPAAGTYYFQCDLHPDEMNGKFNVK